MRSFMKWAMRLAFGLLGIDALIAVADWGSRWEWLGHMLDSHPHFAAMVRGPFYPTILFAVGCLFVMENDGCGCPI